MNREEIKKILPHREPMLLVDEAYSDEAGVAHGTYRVRGDEFFLQGHFPGKPTVPGVILCEIMAQTCCVLLASEVAGVTPYFTSLDKARFKKPVTPGDTLALTCSITGRKSVFCFGKGKAEVDGKIVAQCEFSFALVKGDA